MISKIFLLLTGAWGCFPPTILAYIKLKSPKGQSEEVMHESTLGHLPGEQKVYQMEGNLDRLTKKCR